MKKHDVNKVIPRTKRTSIEDLSAVGNELSEEHLQLVSGGLPIVASYCAASSTYNGRPDTDYYRCD